MSIHITCVFFILGDETIYGVIDRSAIWIGSVMQKKGDITCVI